MTGHVVVNAEGLAAGSRMVYSFLGSFCIGKSCRECMIDGLSLNGYRYSDRMKNITMILRIVSLMSILAMIVTRYNFQCSCSYPGATQPIEYGDECIQYNQLINVMVIHAVFCGFFLISRITLPGMLQEIDLNASQFNITVFKLHYIQHDLVCGKSS